MFSLLYVSHNVNPYSIAEGVRKGSSRWGNSFGGVIIVKNRGYKSFFFNY